MKITSKTLSQIIFFAKALGEKRYKQQKYILSKFDCLKTHAYLKANSITVVNRIKACSDYKQESRQQNYQLAIAQNFVNEECLNIYIIGQSAVNIIAKTTV